jgi:hypothetical protein
MAEQSLSGLTEQQAKEFHEQFKITYTAYVGLPRWCICSLSLPILGSN